MAENGEAFRVGSRCSTVESQGNSTSVGSLTALHIRCESEPLSTTQHTLHGTQYTVLCIATSICAEVYRPCSDCTRGDV